MRYRLLGNSGLRVSAISLGTMTFGEDWGWGSPKEESRKIYDAYREAGGNFVDTANLYTNGTSETLLGDLMQGHRQSIVLATKYSNSGAGKDPNAAGNHRKSMMQAVEASLKRLKTDYIDLYWLHNWDTITPVEKIMRGFDDLVHQGKILYAGISDAPAWWIARANTLAELRGWTRFVGLQIEYSLIQRSVERELIPMAKALDIGVTAWSPLAGGWLSGKYSAGKGGTAPQGGGRLDNAQMRAFVNVDERAHAIAAEVDAVARDIGRSSAQVALAWLNHRDVPVIPIIGARKIEQLRDNLASAELRLSADQLSRLDRMSRIPLGFPHDLQTNEMARTFAFGGMRELIDIS